MNRRGMAMRLAVASLLIWGFTAPRAFALDPRRALTQYVLSVWRMEEGLPHNSVRAVLQTRDGYLWLGTYGGLVRFDGVRFQLFDNRTSRLRDNEVRALAEDAAGTLWIGTTTGGLHRLVKGQVEPFEGGNIEHLTVNALQATSTGALWVGTSGGLYLLRDGRATRYGSQTGLAQTYVNALALANDVAWVGTRVGLFRVAGPDAIAAPIEGFEGAEVLTAIVDRHGRLWAGLRSHVLELRWDDTQRRARVVRAFPIPDAWEGARALLGDRDGNVWVGSYGGGLYRLSENRFERFSTEHGFIDHRPWALWEDREGSLWIGTRSGLARLTDGAATAYSKPEGLPADIVRTVMEDGDGSIWIGSERGLSVLKDGRLRHFGERESLPPVPVRTIVRDRGGTMWIGTDAGLRQVLPDGQRLGPPIARRDGLPGDGIRPIVFDRGGRAWIGTDRGLVVAWRGIGGSRFESVPGLEDLAGQAIAVLFEDRDGGVWIGTLTMGAWRWSEKGIEHHTFLSGASIGVRAFYEDQAGILYVGTVGSGLFVRRPGHPFVRVTTRDGLPEDAVWSIIQDGDALWMSSDRGVFRLSRSTLLAFVEGRAASVEAQRVVGTQDGMKSRECNGGGCPAGVRGRDGRLWYPTSCGAVVIDPRELARDRPAVPVAIEEVVADRRILSGDHGVAAPPGTRDIEFHYTGLSLVDSPGIRFRYRLVGYDPDWVEAGSRRVAYYGRVPPATYEFIVEAAHRNGPWTGAVIRLPVRVEPRVVETLWFRAGAAFGLVAVLGVWLRLRARGQRLRENELRQLVAARTADLERANQQLSDLTTRDDLTGIANHRGFRQTLEQEWLRCLRRREPLSLLMCDIDEFKAYNDGYGHQAGDACLTRIAQTITDGVRRGQDLAARYGGEEFAVILPATDAAGANVVATSIRKAVAELGVPHAYSKVATHVTISVGCATLPVDGTLDLDALVSLADQALYEAKRTGRDRVVSSAQR